MSRGGHNKTHEQTGRYSRLDSFWYYTIVEGMDYKKYYVDREILADKTLYRDRMETRRQTIPLTYVPNNYGGRRMYFICPNCDRRVRYLYYRYEHYLCRTCARLNYRSQQATKGTEAAALKMKRIIKKLDDDSALSPYDMQGYHPSRPKGMHIDTYIRLSLELHRAQEEYHDAFLTGAARIIGKLGGIGKWF